MAKINTELGLKLLNKTKKIGDLTYTFDPSFYYRDGKPKLIELSVDAYDSNGEWLEEFSGLLLPGDLIPDYLTWLAE